MKSQKPELLMGVMLLFLVYLISGRVGMMASGQRVSADRGRPVVCIDSGHGGGDPGKVGVDGTLEKDINLQVAIRLKQYLEASDVEVVMTREEDRGLYSQKDSNKKASDMKNRVEMINEAQADIVISIHQNSYHEEPISGGQVFYYKDSENGKRLAEILQKRFDFVLGEKNTRLAKPNGSYYLLLHVKRPIVIVECGFLSNWAESKALKSAGYQDRLAWTLHMGIMEYLNTAKRKPATNTVEKPQDCYYSRPVCTCCKSAADTAEKPQNLAPFAVRQISIGQIRYYHGTALAGP